MESRQIQKRKFSAVCFSLKKDAEIDGLQERLNVFQNQTNLLDDFLPDEEVIYNLDDILQNIAELNNLIFENKQEVHYNGFGACFQPRRAVVISFFKNGFQVQSIKYSRPLIVEY